jgi:NADH-quinone oxidoreductase subunit E
MTDTCACDLSKLDAVIAKHAARDAAALAPALRDVQEAFRYLPAAAVKALCRHLGVPVSRAFSVAAFHRAFYLSPRGERVVRVCTGAACHGRGAADVLAGLCETLGVTEGGTTKDLKFTVETMNCVGACAMAPVVSVNGELLGNAEPAELVKSVLEVRA